MSNNFQDNNNAKEKLLTDKLIRQGIILILFSPIVSFILFNIYYLILSNLILNDDYVVLLMILNEITVVGIGLSLVIIGCVRNIIKDFKKHI